VRELLQRLFAHQRWADERTLAALRGAAAPPEAALARFMHVVAAEHVWLCRIRGERPQVAVWPPFTQDGCAALLGRNQREFEALLAGAGDAALQREVAYVTSDGRPFTNTVADILLHVALHGVWHRGQVAMLMRQHGLEPVPADYIAFVRGAPAARS
jgi:uncharacterized damage-inducible protein DinB